MPRLPRELGPRLCIAGPNGRSRYDRDRRTLPSYYPTFDQVMAQARTHRGFGKGGPWVPQAHDIAHFRAAELRAVQDDLFASIRKYLKAKMTRQAPRRLYRR